MLGTALHEARGCLPSAVLDLLQRLVAMPEQAKEEHVQEWCELMCAHGLKLDDLDELPAAVRATWARFGRVVTAEDFEALDRGLEAIIQQLDELASAEANARERSNPLLDALN